MAPTIDPVLEGLIDQALRDDASLGLILHGSRGADTADHESDYDLIWVLTDAEYERRREAGTALHIEQRTDDSPSAALVDVQYSCPAGLKKLAANPGWWTPGYADSRILLDKTGEVARLLTEIVTLPEARAREAAAAWLDAYLNAFYRSLKAWRRGDELGGRLHAADSAQFLVRTLFSLERRWPPYHDRLGAALGLLSDLGWNPDELRGTLLELLRSGDPHLQQQLEARVEAFMRARGFDDVFDHWGEATIKRVKGFHFE